MSKEVAVIVLGAWIILVTQLGIPSAWREALIVLSAAAVVAVGFFLRAEALGRRPSTGKALSRKDRSNFPFVENGGAPTSEVPHEQKSPITPLD